MGREGLKVSGWLKMSVEACKVQRKRALCFQGCVEGQCSLDLPLHTQQQVVSEQWRQLELGGTLPTVATQLSADRQAGQVLQPSWLVFHAYG